MPKLVRVLVKVVLGMTIKRATRVIWGPHKDKAVVKRCHKELAGLYEERLQEES
jgi:ATP-dependent Clp protease adaptor protein ClpS